MKQLFNQQRGRIGINGSRWPNGTHYGAGMGDWWCSEFYVWSSKNTLKNFRGADTVEELKEYFGTSYKKVTKLEHLDSARRGDWLAMFDDGHTGMFLARRSDGTIITLEGNSGNKLRIRARDIADISGYGSINSNVK